MCVVCVRVPGERLCVRESEREECVCRACTYMRVYVCAYARVYLCVCVVCVCVIARVCARVCVYVHT